MALLPIRTMIDLDPEYQQLTVLNPVFEPHTVAIHSQLINCSASEVAAMIEGAMHHGASFDVEGNMVDTHGQSEVGFGVTRLLGFGLLPRIKQINKVKLYRPAASETEGPCSTTTSGAPFTSPTWLRSCWS